MSGFRAGESVHYGPDDENFTLNLVYPWAPLCSEDLHDDGPYFLGQNPYTGQNRMESQSAAIPTNVNHGAAQVVVDVRAGVGAAPDPVSGFGPVVAIAAAIPAPIVQTQRLPAGMVSFFQASLR
ncbi:hypothetical protein LZ554_005944 [Drepanopeziza brunnea f. sp. 'monogermtubi']|nr:hypothetical protein LZ554_005944 [Drepanopeziza brunnea f. sp. 'monogermtubi']